MRAVRITMGVVAAALLLPHAFAYPPHRLGLAHVWSGDEPHYLVLLNSLVRDGDFDVSNNYRGAVMGDDEAGYRFERFPLDHHTAWTVNGKYTRWADVFYEEPKYWGTDADGHHFPVMREGVDPALAPTREVSNHWPGLALLIAPVVFPFRGTFLLEPAAIFCAWIATVLAMISFVSIARRFGAPPVVICVALVLTFLGTPLWHYGRALFGEAFAMSTMLGAYALLVRPRTALTVLLAGALGGLCLLVKATNVVMLVPLGVALLMQKQWRDATLFGAPLVLAVLVSMAISHAQFGSYLQGPSGWIPGDFFSGAPGLLVNARHGLLTKAPIVLSALMGWPALLRAQKGLAWGAAAAVLALFLLFSFYGPWHGGMCYGPRYLVPAIPLVMLGLLMRGPGAARWKYADVVVLGLVSLAINFHAAVPYWAGFDGDV